MSTRDEKSGPPPAGGGEERLAALARALADGSLVDWEQEMADVSAEERDALAALAAVDRLRGSIAYQDRSVGPESETRDAAPVDGVPSDVPRRWGHLDIREHLGAGAFGSVYRARDTALEHDVALKVLHPHAEDARRILEEGRRLARQYHPNLVRVYGVDEQDGFVGLRMEFILGETLHAIVRREKMLGEREVILIGIDLCRALAALHGHDILHRDVKAQNVMRERGGRIVLMDLGAGVDLRDDDPAPGGLTGTPLYLAPEVFAGSAASPASDIYSVGVLLFHAASGRFPVEGRTLVELQEAHAAGLTPSLGDVRPDLSPAFVQVVDRSLAPSPDERFPSAGRMGQALSDTLGVDWTDPSSPARGRALQWVVSILGIVLAVLVLSMILRRGLASDDFAIGGWVHDQTGAAVPRATVTIDGHGYRAQTSTRGWFQGTLTDGVLGESVFIRVTHRDFLTETRYAELGSAGLDSLRVLLRAVSVAPRSDAPDGE